MICKHGQKLKLHTRWQLTDLGTQSHEILVGFRGLRHDAATASSYSSVRLLELLALFATFLARLITYNGCGRKLKQANIKQTTVPLRPDAPHSTDRCWK